MKYKRDKNTSQDISLDKQQVFWNEWLTKIQENQGLDKLTLRRGEEVTRLLRAMDSYDLQILEIGCGTGWLSGVLANFGRVTANDLADEVLERARNRFPGVNFLAGDFMSLDFPDDHFDAIVCLETLSHVSQQSAFIRRCNEILKRGGSLMITTQNRIIFKRRSDVMPRAPGQRRIWLTPRQVKNLLISNGFRIKYLSSIAPDGHLGFLRIVNSYKLNRVLSAIISMRNIEKVKEWFGLGQTIIAWAEKN